MNGIDRNLWDENKKNKLSLRWRLALFFSLLFFILMLLSFSFIYFSNREDRENRFIDANLAFSNQSVLNVVNIVTNYYYTDKHLLKTNLSEKIFSFNKDLKKIIITDLRGRIKFSSDEVFDENFNKESFKDSTILAKIRSNKPSYFIIKNGSKNNLFQTFIPYHDAIGRHVATVIYYFSFDSLNSELKALLLKIIYLSILAFIISLLILYVFVGSKIIEPLRELVDKIRLISSKHYQYSKEELDKIFESGNEILSISHWIENNTKQLEHIISIRTAELEEKNAILKKTAEELKRTQEELIESAHQAGKAEIASSVLHNIGNVITTVSARLSMLYKEENYFKIDKIERILNLIKEKKGNLDEFLTKNPKGEKFIQYFENYVEFMKTKIDELNKHLEYLLGRLTIITEILNTQQRYAGFNVIENVNVKQLIQDAVNIFIDKLDRLGIQLVEEYDQSVDNITVERIKLHQVLVNLVKNAIEAIQMGNNEEKIIKIRTEKIDDDKIKIEIADTGCGISKENLKKLFSWGFTTKNNFKKQAGHGFGLHSCANAINSMNGTLSAESEGEGKGAKFIIIIPIDQTKIEKEENK